MISQLSNRTQYQLALSGVCSDAMATVACVEGRPVEFIREAVASGRAVIPANRHHSGLEPMVIGTDFCTKVNANIGNSALSSGVGAELTKLDTAVKYGADTVMDLSTGADADAIRVEILAHSSVPVGTVPIYDAACQVDEPSEMSACLLLEVIEKQAEQGVDYMTLHSGFLRRHISLTRERVLGIVSRGGALLADWMLSHDAENPLYESFDRVLAICREHDVTLSLGDGLRPGCLADASDDAQFAELEVLGELVLRCRKAGVQAMVEGPGHIPLDQVQMNMEREAELCHGAPFYVLGPVVMDCAPGYDHITSAIGAALGAYYGAAMLCYVTPKEHLGLPNVDDVRRGVIAHRIAAHAADVGRGLPGSRDCDDEISRARARFDWKGQFDLALDPEHAAEMRQEALAETVEQGGEDVADDGIDSCEIARKALSPEDGVSDADADRYCSMCGPKFCSLKLSREIMDRSSQDARGA